MSASNGSTVEKSGERYSRHSRSGRSCGGTGNWSAMNIMAMVLGFVFFWPIGLVILFWIIKGNSVKDLPAAIKQKWTEMTGRNNSYTPVDKSENSIFAEFQQTQYDRISEIKEEIKDRTHRFQEFRANAKRRADQEEFDSFMASNPNKS